MVPESGNACCRTPASQPLLSFLSIHIVLIYLVTIITALERGLQAACFMPERERGYGEAYGEAKGERASSRAPVRKKQERKGVTICGLCVATAG